MIQPIDEYPFKFRWGQEVRMIGGKYNGYNAQICWVGETVASVNITIGDMTSEVVERTEFMQDMAEWKGSKTAVELALKPNVP